MDTRHDYYWSSDGEKDRRRDESRRPTYETLSARKNGDVGEDDEMRNDRREIFDRVEDVLSGSDGLYSAWMHARKWYSKDKDALDARLV